MCVLNSKLVLRSFIVRRLLIFRNPDTQEHGHIQSMTCMKTISGSPMENSRGDVCALSRLHWLDHFPISCSYCRPLPCILQHLTCIHWFYTCTLLTTNQLVTRHGSGADCSFSLFIYFIRFTYVGIGQTRAALVVFRTTFSISLISFSNADPHLALSRIRHVHQLTQMHFKNQNINKEWFKYPDI